MHIAAKALEGYELDSSELREYTHLFFARLADSFGAGIATIFGLPVIREAVHSLRRDDGTCQNHAVGDVDSGDGRDDQEEDDNALTFRVCTALTDEKLSAVEVEQFLVFGADSSGERAGKALKKVLFTVFFACCDWVSLVGHRIDGVKFTPAWIQSQRA